MSRSGDYLEAIDRLIARLEVEIVRVTNESSRLQTRVREAEQKQTSEQRRGDGDAGYSVG